MSTNTNAEEEAGEALTEILQLIADEEDRDLRFDTYEDAVEQVRGHIQHQRYLHGITRSNFASEARRAKAAQAEVERLSAVVQNLERGPAVSGRFGIELDGETLLDKLLPWNWQLECEILPDYLPRDGGTTTEPKCVVRHKPSGTFLRHSKGPRQGYFWDAYGDDLHSAELAVVALSLAPAPNSYQLV